MFVASAPDEMRVVGEVLPSEQGTRFQVENCPKGLHRGAGTESC